MAAGTDASSTSPHHPSSPDPFHSILKSLSTLKETNPWIQSALDQAQIAQKSIQETADSAIATTRSRLTPIGQTASAHSQQTLELVKGLKDDFDEYEARAFGKIKEGILAAPVATGAVAAGLVLLLLKGPRRFLYYKTLRLFQSPENVLETSFDHGKDGPYDHAEIHRASLAKADNEFKELRQTFERLKAESDMLEYSTKSSVLSWIESQKAIRVFECLQNRQLLDSSTGVNSLLRSGDIILVLTFQKKASVGEQELIRGRTKLRQAGTLIHKALYSADKIEKRASGLKVALLELPRSDAVRFRTQVSNLVAEVKQEKRVLSKEVSKISNYGISV
ncbi:RGS1-HXK1-interacting protein 1-like protein [Drosera capensis]